MLDDRLQAPDRKQGDRERGDFVKDVYCLHSRRSVVPACPDCKFRYMIAFDLPPESKTNVLFVRVTPTLHAWIAREAEQRGISASGYIRQLVLQAKRDQETPR